MKAVSSRSSFPLIKIFQRTCPRNRSSGSFLWTLICATCRQSLRGCLGEEELAGKDEGRFLSNPTVAERVWNLTASPLLCQVANYRQLVMNAVVGFDGCHDQPS